MFKLISLQSEEALFDPIFFHDGINIILGRYSKGGKDVNGIGKTTVIELIDYCLLADGPKKNLFSSKYAFLKESKVRLCFTIEAKEYSIRRAFKVQNSAELSVSGGTFNEYTDVELRAVIGNLIIREDDYSGISSSSWYRTIMNFFVQDDHSFHAREADSPQKFLKGNHRVSELLTYNLFLIGVDNTKIWEYDQKSVELKKLQGDKTRLVAEVKKDTGRGIGEYRAEIESIQGRIKEYEKRIDEFKFSQSYEDTEEKITQLSHLITVASGEHSKIRKRLSEIEESLGFDIEVDPEKISNTFEKLHKQFSDFIRRELEDVIEFRKQLVANRKEFLSQRKQAHYDKMKELQRNIVEYDNQRSALYKFLDEKKAFDAIRNSFRILVQEQTDLVERKQNIIKIDEIEEKIAKAKADTASVVSQIIEAKPQIHSDIQFAKEIFLEIVGQSIEALPSDGSAYFSIDPRSNANSPLNIEIEIPRGASLGKGRFKLLAYDMMLFMCILNQQRNLPRFLVHDGVFHGIAHKTRINYLNFLYKKLTQFSGAQYIITLNEDELTIPEETGESVAKLEFDIEKLCIAELSDTPDRMLFRHEFG